jgi:uncharacterized protein
MPHICTRCNNVFDKGEDILKGCPVCGWKKFLFTRKDPKELEASSQGAIITKAMGVRNPPKTGLISNEKKSVPAEEQNIAQTIPNRMIQKTKIASKERIAPEEDLKRSIILNQPVSRTKDGTQVESIKITAPGTYELNLPTLFEREELIMAIKEGTYLIDLTSAFRKGKKD